MKNFYIGFFGSHNATIAISDDEKILEVVEVERYVSKKNAALWFYYNIPSPYNIETIYEIKNYLSKKYNVEKYKKVIYNSIDKEYYKIFDAEEYEYLTHHFAHAYSGLYQSPYNKALIVSFDGGSDEGFFNVYLGDKNTHIEKIYSGKRDYAVPYMMPAHYIPQIKNENIFWGNLVYAGKLMGLAGYGKINNEYVKLLTEFYNSGDTGNILKTQATFEKIFGSKKFVDEDGADLAASNQYVFEKLFLEEFEQFMIEYQNLPLIIVGGCGLNILLNTRLAKYMEVFVPPNPNDCGLTVGLLSKQIKPKTPVDCTYIGPEAWDRNNLMLYAIEKKAVKASVKSIAIDIKNKKIIGVMRGRSEHGPRALGNRSILCSASAENMKDILNRKVKNREYYRPFAPIVRYEDVNKYFDWNKESRWMSFCVNVKEEYQNLLKSITHVDNTARVQTITKEQNSFLYDLLTELEILEEIPVLINTSFNIAGKPILNTYKEAIYMLDNTEIDAILLEDFYIKK
jgi:carbamoyltransferase